MVKMIVSNIIKLITFIIIIFIGGILLKSFNDISSLIYTKKLESEIIKILYYTTLGMIIGVESRLENYRLKGSWHVDLNRFIFLGIPVAYLALQFIIYTSDIKFIRLFMLPIYKTDMNQFTQIPLQILLGYILITCLKKNKQA